MILINPESGSAIFTFFKAFFTFYRFVIIEKQTKFVKKTGTLIYVVCAHEWFENIFRAIKFIIVKRVLENGERSALMFHSSRDNLAADKREESSLNHF